MYKEIYFTEKYNSKGDPVFAGIRVANQTFDIETVGERIINLQGEILELEKGSDKVFAEIEAAKTNVEMNKGVLGVINENPSEITYEMASAAEILFRNMKAVLSSNVEGDKQAILNEINARKNEIEMFEKLLIELKELNIPNETKSIQGGTASGKEEVSPAV